MEKWHGTVGGWSNHKCRCEECRTAWNAYCADRKARRKNEVHQIHGQERSYQYGCRCQPCASAHAVHGKAMYQLRKGRAKPAPGSPCDCCNQVPRRLVMDHDHSTMEFRGWLCDSCNTGLGKFGDSVTGLEMALAYLRR